MLLQSGLGQIWHVLVALWMRQRLKSFPHVSEHACSRAQIAPCVIQAFLLLLHTLRAVVFMPPTQTAPSRFAPHSKSRVALPSS